jgi:steroid 5-alpha reductase family enzyme
MGSSFMMIADAQKYFCLRLKKELINYGMFKLTRNPNYLGEVMLYGSFAMLSGRVLPWLILISVWGSVFVIMIYLKELSFTRKPQWEEYRKQSWVFLPKLWNNDDLSYLTYLFMIVGAGYLYGNGGLFKVLQNFMK